MVLKHLRIQDFRNVSEATLTFRAGLNVLLGENGQGKTNLLEAIGLLANGRSFRRAPPAAMRRHGQPGFYLHADVYKRDIHHRLTFTVLGRQPAAHLNGKAMRAVSAMGEALAVVVLTPDAPPLVRGAPGERRDYLDWVIFCHDRSHAGTARDYQTALKARNHLLRHRCDDARQFDAWEEQLSLLGARMALKRRQLIAVVQARFPAFLDAMALAPDEHLWQVSSQLDRFPEWLTETPPPEEAVAARYQTLLHQSRQADQRTGNTSIGPHRDDPAFLQRGRSLARFGSRGEQKRFLLALKLVEADLLRQRLGVAPLLLLDDPTAELDQDAAHRLMRLLSSGDSQLFIATCTTDALTWPATVKPACYFRVTAGAFREEAV